MSSPTTTNNNTDTAGPESTAPPVGHSEPRRARSRLMSNRLFQGSVSPLAFVVTFAAFGIWQGETFLNVATRVLDVHSNAPILLLGLSVMITLQAGQFDLSVASMTTLATYLTVALVVHYGWPFWAVITGSLAVGILGGLVNGLLVTRLQINTFIATLGSGGVFLGFSSVLSKGSSIVPTLEVPLPSWFSGRGSFGVYTTKVPFSVSLVAVLVLLAVAHVAAQRLRPGTMSPKRWRIIELVVALVVVAVAIAGRSWLAELTWPVVLLVLVGVVLWVMFKLTVTGRNIQAVGSNRVAARLAGVRTEREIVKAFVFGGLLAALAGIVLAAQQGAATPDVATGFLLPAFAAAFLSTVIFSAGRFSVWGTILGGCFLLWVGQGLIVGGLPFTWLPVVNGAVLIAAVASSTALRREQK